MSDLRAAEVPAAPMGGATSGAGGIGFGTDVTAEVERLRASILALAIAAGLAVAEGRGLRSEEHTSELQSH